MHTHYVGLRKKTLSPTYGPAEQQQKVYEAIAKADAIGGADAVKQVMEEIFAKYRKGELL